MKHYRISLLIIILLLAGCSGAVISPTPTQIKSTLTFTPISTNTLLPTVTATEAPLMTEISCKPTTNPFPTQIPNGNYLFHQNFSIGKVCSFSGEIKRGQSFQEKITQGLVFCITPRTLWVENDGWTINISDEIGKPCDDNFAGIATPPFRGDNPTYIFGVQFTDENKVAFTRSFVREFNFVFNQRDYETLWASYYPMPLDNKIDVTKIKSSPGIFTIQDLKLGNLIPNEKPWVASMKFEVKIYLPSD